MNGSEPSCFMMTSPPANPTPPYRPSSGIVGENNTRFIDKAMTSTTRLTPSNTAHRFSMEGREPCGQAGSADRAHDELEQSTRRESVRPKRPSQRVASGALPVVELSRLARISCQSKLPRTLRQM